ncbi:CAAX amino terminal protease self- immunity [Rubripirellula tenax]|uniref:CAAX amino terminal protease self-immunity n=1 Tax=Rubripirellula tenax TaxID=2528015 RepID=A0A5C6FH36_9BACT|nr:type II CAAX endopeptidase family protein [Rubripirellula tenax]TWU60758.1 CAAX amino terminal protease self- immunity [Rubripirellula tenax]
MQKIIRLFWNANERRLRSFWRLAIHVVSLIAGLIVLMVITQVFVALIDEVDYLAYISCQAILQNIIVVVLVVFACVWPDRRPITALGLRLDNRWWANLGYGFTLGAALMTVIFLIELRMGWITVEPTDASTGGLIAGQAFWILAMLFVGFGEEILSRGHHFKNLCEGLRFLGLGSSLVIASVLSSLFFAMLHFFNPGSSIVSILAVTLAGVMFCIARVTTGSLAAPIGMHFAWNYFQGGVFGFPVSGNQVGGSLLYTTQLGNPIMTGGDFGPEAGVLGILAIVLAMAAFAYWPKTEQPALANAIELTRPPHRKASTSVGSELI